MSKTETGPDVRAQSIHDLICERRELAIEAGRAGAISYGYGICNPMLVGEALTLALRTPEETEAAICEKLNGKTIDEKQLDETILHFFFLLGIYRSFLAKTEGKYKGGSHVNK